VRGHWSWAWTALFLDIPAQHDIVAQEDAASVKRPDRRLPTPRLIIGPVVAPTCLTEAPEANIREKSDMSNTSATARTWQSCGVVVVAGILAAMPAKAADQVPPPPYQLAGLSGVGISVVWDEAAVRKALPPGVQPAKGMTGGITIYAVPRGYAITPYSAAYLYVDVEGFDSPEGIKGRWMLAGVYGPQPKTAATLTKYYGFPLRTGEARLEPIADGKRAVGILNGQDVVAAEIKSVPNGCAPGAVQLNYLSLLRETEQVVVNTIPFAGDFCKADLVSAKITAPSGDAFSSFPIAKLISASEFSNGAATFTAPRPIAK
jgi:hypothetical protein